jgi:hypothetical protein
VYLIWLPLIGYTKCKWQFCAYCQVAIADFWSHAFFGRTFFLLIEKEKYGLQIVTAEGEKEVVVSKLQEYIVLIDEALTKALQHWKF